MNAGFGAALVRLDAELEAGLSDDAREDSMQLLLCAPEEWELHRKVRMYWYDVNTDSQRQEPPYFLVAYLLVDTPEEMEEAQRHGIRALFHERDEAEDEAWAHAADALRYNLWAMSGHKIAPHQG